MRKTKAVEENKAEAIPPPLLLAENWDGIKDPHGYIMSEKLDGVRAYWNGREFISRLGNKYYAPAWFCSSLPKNIILDGELWLERKAFQKTVSIVRRQDESKDWKSITYQIFDMPECKKPFAYRVIDMKKQLKKLKYAEILDQQMCEGIEHLKSELARVESLGGEGLMLRDPESMYRAGRNSTLLKVKTFHDAEATVIEHLPGEGRHKGRLGALLVKLEDGTEFSVGTGFSDKEREDPPTLGSRITYRFQELSSGGVPRFPSFVRAMD